MSTLKTACIKVDEQTLNEFKLACIQSNVKMSPKLGEFMRSFVGMQEQVSFNEAIYALREKLAQDNQALALLDTLVHLYITKQCD